MDMIYEEVTVVKMITKKKEFKYMLPKYVSIEGICMLRLRGDQYYRDAGVWSVEYRVKKTIFLRKLKVYIHQPNSDFWEHLHGKELKPCTEQEWREDNRGHVSELSEAEQKNIKYLDEVAIDDGIAF